MSATVLVRYGAIGEVARFRVETDVFLDRNRRVVIRSTRGLEIGTLLEAAAPPADRLPADEADDEPAILRAATPEDEQFLLRQQSECLREFKEWQQRIIDWNVDLQLIDLEWTIDRSKLILYVLNDRGPACTTLALQAAAAGLGVIEVQPVDAEGLVRMETSGGGGCGSGGCGSGGGCH